MLLTCLGDCYMMVDIDDVNNRRWVKSGRWDKMNNSSARFWAEHTHKAQLERTKNTMTVAYPT